MNYDLSVVIPARNEQFLSRTVENILQNIRGNTEIIVVLDGYWDENGVPVNPRVTVIHNEEAIGQRAAINQAVRASSAKYVMKIDAHCKVDEGFDVKMVEAMAGHDDWTMVPKMYNLHGFDWVCDKGHRIYQGPTPKACNQCGGPMHKEIIFEPRWRRESEFYRFDKTLHFQYWGSFKHDPRGQGDIAPTLSLQGSCFMLTRDKFWELNICDEQHGSWGQQGTEVALKTWMSGGQVMVNKKTWYAHLFRTQGGDFGFPFPLSGSDVEKARKYSRHLFFEGGFKGKYTLEEVLEKFRPVPDWHVPEEKFKKPSKGVIYYTHNVGDEKILEETREQIKRGMKEKHIVCVSLKPTPFGKNVVLYRKPGYLTMAKQILAGLEASNADVVFFCEHDVLYHPKHFDFIPYRRDVIYYNTNVWRVRHSDGFALFTNNLQQLSGLCAYRDVLITHYRKRVELLEKFWNDLHSGTYIDDKFAQSEFNTYVRKMGFEPGTHNRAERVDDLTSDNYQAEFPNIDIRHNLNTTPSRWSKDQFVNKKFTDGWTESHIADLPGWDLGYLIKVFVST